MLRHVGTDTKSLLKYPALSDPIDRSVRKCVIPENVRRKRVSAVSAAVGQN